MSVVASSIGFMGQAADGVASSMRDSMSKIPIIGYFFKGPYMGALQNSVRGEILKDLSKPRIGRSFALGNLL